MEKELIEDALDVVKAYSYNMFMGCENAQEFNYIRAVSQAIISFLEISAQNNMKIDWVKIYSLLDTIDTETLDPELIEAMMDYRIAIVELFEGLE